MPQYEDYASQVNLTEKLEWELNADGSTGLFLNEIAKEILDFKEMAVALNLRRNYTEKIKRLRSSEWK